MKSMRIKLILLLSIFGWMGLGESQAALPLKGSENHSSARLSEVLSEVLSKVLNDEKLTGLALESAESQGQLRKQAQMYAKWVADLEAGRFRNQKQNQMIPEWCSFDAKESNPFCPLLVQKLESKAISKASTNTSKRTSRLEKRENIQKISNLLRKADIDSLQKVEGLDLMRAAGSFKSLTPLANVIQRVIKEETCSSSALILALGLRVEEEFPEDEFKKMAHLLYQKGKGCSRDSAYFQVSYRLGLLQIWEGSYQEAERTLEGIMNATDDLNTQLRVGYWRYFCADKLKKEDLKKDLQKWLFEKFPLSFHGLLADTKKPQDHLSFIEPSVQRVEFRSNQSSEASSVTKAAEALIQVNQKALASELLRERIDLLKGLEPRFRLYWAVLLSRTGSRIASFNLMASTFRTNSELICKETLELMYPMEEVHTVQEAFTALDPYLVLSVIRQESAFNAHARSPAGALGLMQLRLPTARSFGKVSRKELFQPRKNIQLGVRYLKHLLNSFNGEIELALAAYNAGPARLRTYLKRYPADNRLLFLDLMPIRETREYVSAIGRNYYFYSKLYQKKFEKLLDGKKVPTLESSLFVALSQ